MTMKYFYTDPLAAKTAIRRNPWCVSVNHQKIKLVHSVTGERKEFKTMEEAWAERGRL